MVSLQNVTTEDLLNTVTNVLTQVPKKQLKSDFVRHYTSSEGDPKKLTKAYACFADVYKQFQTEFAGSVAENLFLQKHLVQFVCAIVHLSKLQASDEYGLIGGAALYVSATTETLAALLFPKCSPAGFCALVSSLLSALGVDRIYHGLPQVVIMSLQAEIEDADEAYALAFPGPYLAVDSTEHHWSTFLNAQGPESRPACLAIFGLGAETKVSKRLISYYNPASVAGFARDFSSVFSVDTVPPPVDVQEFEADDDDEDTTRFDEGVGKLKKLLS